MAYRDVKNYYNQVFLSFLAAKADLETFTEAFNEKSVYVTEEKLAAIKEEVARIEENYLRVSYLLYLFEMPNKNNKKAKYHKQNKELEAAFNKANADIESINLENKSILAEIKKMLTEILDAKQNK